MTIEEIDYLQDCIHSLRRNLRHIKHEYNYLFLHAASSNTHAEYADKAVSAMKVLEDALSDIQLDLYEK